MAALGAYQLLSDSAHRARVPQPNGQAGTHDSSHKQRNNQPPQSFRLRERALLFGDSITQHSFGNKTTGEAGGWGALLATEFARTVDVANRGFSGYTTRGALRVADFVLPLPSDGVAASDSSADKEYLFVTIFFGANDSTDSTLNPEQSVPVEEFKANLAKLVDHAQRVAQHVVIIAPPPVDGAAWAKSREMPRADRENSRTEQYCEAGRAVAQEKGALFVDTFHGMLRRDDWRSMLNDGLHLSPLGNQVLYELLTAELRDKAGITDEHLPLDFPLWRELNTLEITPAGHFSSASVRSLPYKCRTYDV